MTTGLFRLKINGKNTDSIIFKHDCHVCGHPNASFGSNVNLREFYRLHAEGRPDLKLLGTWTCGIDKCVGKNN